MDEEYPDQGAKDENQDLDAERTWARAPVAGKTPPPAAGLPAAGLPPAGDDRVAPLTGDNRVDRAVAALSRLPGTPADEHVAVLEEVHGRLRDILGEFGEDSARRP